MAFIFDHLTAIVVGTVLLVALVAVQQRARFQANDAVSRYAMEQQNQAFIETLRRDFENMRTRKQAIDSLGYYQFRLNRTKTSYPSGATDWNTSTFTFPTLADPALGAASPIVQVSYRLEHTGIWVGPYDTGRWAFEMVRYVEDGSGSGFVRTGGSAPNLRKIEVDLWRRDGAKSTWAHDAPDPVRVKIDLETTTDLPPDRITADQEVMTQADFQRQSYTLRPLNIAFNEADTVAPPSTGTPPPLPPEPPVPSPPAPPPVPDEPDTPPGGEGDGPDGPGSTGSGSSSSSGSGSSGSEGSGSSSTSPTPPSPAPPTPTPLTPPEI